MVRELCKPVLVTGAAGFIGSHLTDHLVGLGLDVVGFDNLSAGDIANLTHATKSSHFRFVEDDLLDFEATRRVLGECELVYHLAADPEVRAGAENPEKQLRQNLHATFNLLEALRKRGTSTRLVFASTSTVYGEPSVIPTPEDHGPLLPISTYGATKLACEALAASYSQLLPLQVLILRFANIVGTRARHGVIHDFITKLRKDPRRLEVLGDGTQTKSYLHVDDCVHAFLMALDDKFWGNVTEVYNIGSDEKTNVLKIAEFVMATMGLKNVTICTTGGRAWPGDIRTMQLDISKIKRYSWKPGWSSDEAVRLAVQQLIQELQIK
jgi:UDP-glucose 4-epimerase